MANNPRGYQRDKVTGRFARRPVEGVDADSRFGPMADSIEDIDNVSGAPSPNTEMHARYAPAGDAQGGKGPRCAPGGRRWCPTRRAPRRSTAATARLRFRGPQRDATTAIWTPLHG